MRDLVEKAKDGDLEAFGTLIDHYRDMVYGASYAIPEAAGRQEAASGSAAGRQEAASGMAIPYYAKPFS